MLRSKVAVFAELHRRQRQASVANRKLLDEVVARGRVEEQLRELNNKLELRVTDRTEALATQKRLYQSITDQASVALFITDDQHRCVFMNPAAELLTGFTLSASCGRVLQDVVQCAQAVDLTRLLEPRDATEVASAAKRRAEEVFVHEDGHSYDVSLTVSALYDEHGTSVGTIIEAQDISQRTRAQAQLNDADRRKDGFLATLAHELRNPLASVRNAVQYLHLRDAELPELRWARDVIDRQTQAMARLIDDLMDVSRISRGRIELQRRRVDLAKVVRNAIETSQSQIA